MKLILATPLYYVLLGIFTGRRNATVEVVQEIDHLLDDTDDGVSSTEDDLMGEEKKTKKPPAQRHRGGSSSLGGRRQRRRKDKADKKFEKQKTIAMSLIRLQQYTLKVQILYYL